MASFTNSGLRDGGAARYRHLPSGLGCVGFGPGVSVRDMGIVDDLLANPGIYLGVDREIDPARHVRARQVQLQPRQPLRPPDLLGQLHEVVLTLDGLPAGVKATLENIPANAAETTLKLVTTDKAPVGTNTLKVLGTSLQNDRTYRQRTGNITLIISAPEATEMPVKAAAATAASPVGPAK